MIWFEAAVSFSGEFCFACRVVMEMRSDRMMVGCCGEMGVYRRLVSLFVKVRLEVSCKVRFKVSVGCALTRW